LRAQPLAKKLVGGDEDAAFFIGRHVGEGVQKPEVHEAGGERIEVELSFFGKSLDLGRADDAPELLLEVGAPSPVLRARHGVAHDVAVGEFLDVAVARRDVGVDEGGCGDRRRGGERQHERESGSHGFHAEARQSCQHIFDTSRVTPAWFNDTDAGVFLTMSGIIRRSRTAAT